MSVQILLSTYNGQRYLREQIDSLLSQNCREMQILIRDDGSTDGTIPILKEYEKKYQNITVYYEENAGVLRSFFELLKRSEGDYIAFCDQDDVWLEDKIERAVCMLEQEAGPALYCSNKILTDGGLVPLKRQQKGKPTPGFGNAVVECICTGCTAVMNRSLARVVRQRLPEHAILHDWWVYLTACYHGKVIFDENAYILYRQHENNVVGASGGFWAGVKAKAAYLKKSRGALYQQLEEFSQLFHGEPEKDKLLADLLDTKRLPARLRMASDRRIYRQNRLDGCIMRILLLGNKLL